MNSSTSENSEYDVLGAQPSIVEHFSIEGLYGYRTVSLSSDYAATILIARNGAGKTTLLGAMDAFLRGHFSRLDSLEFSCINCKLRGVDTMLRLTKADVTSVSTPPQESGFIKYARLFQLEPVVLFEFIESEYPELSRKGLQYGQNETLNTIMTKSGHVGSEVRRICDEIAKSLTGRNANVDYVKETLALVLRDVEIVYLPTYRRIELSIDEEPDEEKRLYYTPKPSVRTRLGIKRRSLFNADIQFGLSDISDRLYRLNQEILFSSNQGYREISANIINELISGTFERDAPSLDERPDKESLSLFFSRLKDGRRIGPFGDVAIPDIDRIYTGDGIPHESTKFLNYFLAKLNTVIKATRGIELMVEEFVKNCNRYLSSQDESASTRTKTSESASGSNSVDNKILRLDKRNLKVAVEDVAANRKINIDFLSSGEKQMISLFARLYLYPGKKIVLIDEPELSLSIHWQKKILLDIVKAPNCAQVIAITHSPFVFDNELEPFARTMSLAIDTPTDSTLNEDDDESEEGLNG